MKAKHWAVVKMFEKLGFKNVSLNSTFGSLNKVVKKTTLSYLPVSN